MSNDTKGPDPSPTRPGEAPDARGGATAGQQGGPPTADETVTPFPQGAGDEASDRAEMAALRADLEETKARLDRALRAYAEADNVRKRLEREKDDAAKYAITKLARDIVAFGDNFRRAVETAPTDKLAQDPALKAFFDGVELTERELIGTLERHGVRRVDPTGEPFNPRQHQAVMEMESAEASPGTILQVFQAGYTIEDRMLRPAMVIVAKAAAKADASALTAVQAPVDDDAPAGGSRADGTAGTQEG